MPINISGAAQNIMNSVAGAAVAGEVKKGNILKEQEAKYAAQNEILGIAEQTEDARVKVAGVESQEALERLEFGQDAEGNQITMETKRDEANKEVKGIAEKIIQHDLENGPAGSQTGSTKGKRTELVSKLEKAQTAFDSLQDEINARTTLRNNYEILQTKLASKKSIYEQRFGGKK